MAPSVIVVNDAASEMALSSDGDADEAGAVTVWLTTTTVVACVRGRESAGEMIASEWLVMFPVGLAVTVTMARGWEMR
jgi:hypothetical protein